ncbi:MAG: HlyD family efflux transporter periplasmic adaptor subunit [Thermodesulfobacteriota bacterium]
MATKQAYPALRTDIDFVPRVVDEDNLRWFLTAAGAEHVYEFGEEEYFLCTQLDGSRTLSQVGEAFRCRFDIQISEANLAAFVNKLRGLDLLQSAPLPAWDAPTAPDRGRMLFACDRLLARLVPLFAGCFSGWFAAGTGLLLAAAIFVLCRSIDSFVYEVQLMQDIYSAAIFLLVPFFGLFYVLPLAEFAKGIACRHYGGYASGLRLRFFYRLLPMLHLDLWDSLWFLPKSRRLRVIGAGPIAQSLLFSLAVIGWDASRQWGGVHVGFTFLLLAAGIFFVLNLLPLAERDGYLLLVNQLEKDNFADRAENWFLARIFLEDPPEALARDDRRLFFWFGGFFLLFRVVVAAIFLGFAGFTLIDAFQGTGAFLFLCIVFLRFEDVIKRLWIRTPVMGRMLSCQNGEIRMRLLVKWGALLVLVVVMFLPYPFEVGGDFRILPAHQQGIRAEVAGTITEVLAVENQFVSAGQPVARLDDRLHRSRLAVLQASVEETQAMIRLRQSGAKPEEIDKARQQVAAARKNLEYSAKEEERALKMRREKALSDMDYQAAKRKRDMDEESLKYAETNLALVKSGARDEEIKGLEAELRRLEAEMAQVQGDLEKTTLISPMDGVMITPYLHQRIGQRLEAGDLFSVIEDSRTVRAEVEVPEEDIIEVATGAGVKLRTWADPTTTFSGKVVEIAPVAYEKSWHRLTRALSEREQLIGQREVLKEKGRVIRVISEFPNDGDVIKTDMTGWAKIEGSPRPVAVAFTRWLMRFFYVEVWSWIP